MSPHFSQYKFRITYLFLGLNLFMMVVGVFLDGLSFLYRPSNQSFILLGSMNSQWVASGDYWRIIMAGYLHAGFLHIGFNMMALYSVGRLIEYQIGSLRFFVVYTLALIGGSGIHFVVASKAVAAGASGALFGLIGFGLSFTHFHSNPQAKLLRNQFFKWALIGFGFGFLVSGIDNLGHLGGFVVGLVLGYVVIHEFKDKSPFLGIWKTLAFCLASVTLLSFGYLFYQIIFLDHNSILIELLQKSYGVD